MPTDIYFAGASVRIEVDEDPSQVAAAFSAAAGLPFRLAGPGGRGEVYINPATVAFWWASEPSPEPEPEPTGREEVTDIWGQPLRNKPRR